MKTVKFGQCIGSSMLWHIVKDGDWGGLLYNVTIDQDVPVIFYFLFILNIGIFSY